MSEIGFIILRHVNNELTNNYWIRSYLSIRKLYPDNKILIIDDNSNYQFININEKLLYKTSIIRSEFPGRAELLPYYYFLKNKLFDIAVIIHDSVFINSYIDFSVEKYKLIWCFEHGSDQIEDETNMLKLFNDDKLLEFHQNKSLWKGCFGGMSVIKYDFLETINNKYNLSLLLDKVITRYNRCSFERVIACLLQIENPMQSVLGDIHQYCPWGISFKDIEKYNHLPIVKIWTGR